MTVKISGTNDIKLTDDYFSKTTIMSDFFLTNIDDINKEILLLLEDEYLSNANVVNKYAVSLCASDNFWNERIQRTYDVNLNKYKEDDLTYRQVYFILRNTKSIVNLIVTAAEHGYLPLVKNIKENYEKECVGTYCCYRSALEAAIINRKLPVVTYLIENGTKISPKDRNTLTAIVEWENIHLIDILLANVPDLDINTLYEVARNSAIKTGYVSIIQYLKDAGANTDAHANYIIGPIQAARNGRLAVLKFLQENGSDIHANNDFPLLEAATQGHLQVVQYLVEDGAKIPSIIEAYDKARTFGRKSVMKYLQKVRLDK